MSMLINEKCKTDALEFDQRHKCGDEPVFVGKARAGGYYLFKDGARREYHELFYMPGEEPPCDDRQRKKLILQYHEVKTSLATSAYNELLNELQLQAKYAEMRAYHRQAPMPPSDEQIAHLSKLKVEMKVWQTLLTKLREEFGDLRSDLEIWKEARGAGQRADAQRALGRISAVVND